MAAVMPAALALSGVAGAQTSVPLVQLPISVPSALQQSMLVSHKASADVIHVAICMPPSNPKALQSFVDDVSNPKSANYHKWATPTQLGQRFGQPQATVQNIVNYLKSKGFNVTLVGDSRITILADATVAQAESAFNTTINNYHVLAANPNTRSDFYSFAEPIQFPKNLAPAVLTITGLDNIAKPVPMLHKVAKASAHKGRLNQQPLTPTQTRTLYGVAPLWKAGYQGLGQNIGITSFDGFKLSNVPLYYKQFSLPTPSGGVGSNITVVTVDGGSMNATPGGEADLDIQMVLGMAPLSTFRVYDGGGSLTDVLTKEQNDNICDIISESYGFFLDAGTATACHNIHLLMNAQGMTYNKATGDSGTTLEPFAYGDYDPEILLIGGTIANTDNSGNRTSEVAWQGGGGGWATESVPFNTLPTWLKGKGVPATINFRLVPDLALNAAGDSTGAYQFYFNGALEFGYDGTSFASPVFAGGFGIMLQDVKALGGSARLGRVQDAIYLQNGRSDVWTDVTSGFNGVLPNGSLSQATPFWDFTTGWGAINFQKYAQAIAVTALTVYPTTSVSAYDNVGLSPAVIEGTSASGSVSYLSAIDGLGYALTAVKEPLLGKVATVQATFATNLVPAKASALSLTFAGSAAAASTVSVYLLNQSTGKYTLMKSYPGSAISAATTVVVPTGSLTSYINSAGTVQALIRYLVPNSRLPQVNNYQFFLDELYVSGAQFIQ